MSIEEEEGVHRTTAGRIFNRVLQLTVEKSCDFIVFPTTSESIEIAIKLNNSLKC